MLRRYSRNELVVLLYQTNAPSADPLSNKTGQLREDFYQTQHSAPHTFIEGQEISAEGEAPSTQPVFEKLTAAVDKQLDTPGDADLHVLASRTDNQIHVEVRGTAKNASQTARLQIMLVETEVTYSGENGLRYHPMVVRASANRTADSTGYAISNENFTRDYNFDLTQVSAENLKWYDEYIEALKKRLPPDFEVGGFREKKNIVNPAKIAIVVFVQDDKTKHILQSSYSAVKDTKSVGEAGSANVF
jgi:hypothetical protein